MATHIHNNAQQKKVIHIETNYEVVDNSITSSLSSKERIPNLTVFITRKNWLTLLS